MRECAMPRVRNARGPVQQLPPRPRMAGVRVVVVGVTNLLFAIYDL